jgi:flagellar biosynthesis/type III secretory pathway protein FliH
MSKIGKTLFGGTDRSAQRATQAQNQLSQQFIKAQEGRAQDYLSGAMPRMQDATYQGFQGAADVVGSLAPQQINALQQGNVAAQQQLIQGLPAFQRALMGQPLNYNPQAFQAQVNPALFQRQVFNPMAQMQGAPQQQPSMPQMPGGQNMGGQIDFSRLLGGMVR